MPKDQEQTMTELQELVCDNYCKWPGYCSSQEVLEKHCDECQLVKLLSQLKN